MSNNEGWHAAMMERRLLVSRLLLHKQKPGAIHTAVMAAGHECSYSTIRRDIDALEASWWQDLLIDPLAMKARELAEIDEAEAECWTMYTQLRDQRWLTELRLWKERKAKLMGLDAVQVTRTEVTGLEGALVQAQGIEVLFGDPVARRLIDKLSEREVQLESEGFFKIA